MKHFERGARRESLDAAVARVAGAYGFTSQPLVISKRKVADVGDEIDHQTAAQIALIQDAPTAKQPTQVWGMTKKGTGTTLSFTVLAARHAISHALVIKTALSIAELAGFNELTVSVSSIGDAESRRRFVRELGSFFKKNAEALTPEIRQRANQNPEQAYRDMLVAGGELAERLPRPIDYLSENSRKTMTDTLALFESADIPYILEPHLSAVPGVHTELVFALHGVDRHGERHTIATGGRFDELMKKREKAPVGHTVGISLTVPEAIEPEETEEDMSCFVVHVGDAAKLRSFALLEALWRANVAVGQALMVESLRDQMTEAQNHRSRYVAIIGQRESLDGTVILRNTTTQMQGSIPADKLVSAVSRAKR